MEWSQTLIGTDEKQKNIISTSHIQASEGGQGYLFNYGYSIRGHIHSHPYNPIPSDRDKLWATKLHIKFPNAFLKIYFDKKYFEYGNNK